MVARKSSKNGGSTPHIQSSDRAGQKRPRRWEMPWERMDFAGKYVENVDLLGYHRISPKKNNEPW